MVFLGGQIWAFSHEAVRSLVMNFGIAISVLSCCICIVYFSIMICDIDTRGIDVAYKHTRRPGHSTRIQPLTDGRCTLL